MVTVADRDTILRARANAESDPQGFNHLEAAEDRGALLDIVDNLIALLRMQFTDDHQLCEEETNEVKTVLQRLHAAYAFDVPIGDPDLDDEQLAAAYSEKLLVRAEAMEAAREILKTPFTPMELRQDDRLIAAADHLLHDHDCACSFYEQFQRAWEEAGMLTYEEFTARFTKEE